MDDVQIAKRVLAQMTTEQADSLIREATENPSEITRVIDAYVSSLPGQRRFGKAQAIRIALFRVWLQYLSEEKP